MVTRLLVVCLSLLLSASLAGAATQTINIIPANNASLLSNLQDFLREEDAERYGEHFDSYVESGGTHGSSGSLTATISAAVTYVGGFRVSAPAIARTYTASRRTFVYIYSHDSAVAGDFTVSGGTACTIPAGNGIVGITNGGSFVFVQCSTGSTVPTVAVAAGRGIALLMAVDTSGTAITATHPLKNPFPVRPSMMLRVINVREYGAVGDNVQDDTLAIQTAANAACNRNHALFFSAGSYRITAPITSVNTCPLTLVYGAGYDQTFVYVNGTTINGFLFTQQAPVIVRDMRIEVTGGAATAGSCIAISGPDASTLNAHSIVERMFLNGCFVGIDWLRTSNIQVLNNKILSGISLGIRGLSTPALADSGDNLIFGNEINPSITTGTNIYIETGGGLRILSNKIQNANIGIWLAWNGTINSAQLLIANNSMDGQTTNAIVLDRQVGIVSTFGDVSIVNNFMGVGTATGEAISATTQTPGTWLRNLSIVGNSIICGSAGFAIRLASGDGVVVSGNNIECATGTSTGIGLGVGVTQASIGTNSFRGATTRITNDSPSASIVPRVLFGSASLDFGATAANTCEDLTIPVTNARDGDSVELEIPNALASAAGTVFFKWVSANDTVTVRRCNVGVGAASNPAAATVGALVFDRNYLP